MSDRFDRDLRERFAALREADAVGAPSFPSVRRGRPAAPRSRSIGLLPAAALVATALVTAVVLMKAPGRPASSADDVIAQATSLSAWTAPTDAWLKLSGLEIPSSVPSLSLSSVTLPQAASTATDSGELR
jgi:hypothetical protein